MYTAIGYSKQAIHQYIGRSNRYKEEVFHLIELIRQIRDDHPTMCCRAMYYKINPSYIGRDRFEAICRDFGFTSKRRKAKHKTTDSSGVKRFDNLLNDQVLTDIDQAWSSDITYYEIDGSFYYITFILDCYSRRILGYNVSNRLLTQHTTLPSMRMAVKTRNNQVKQGIIFHSDGGGQYYADEFLSFTEQYHFQNSMCKHAYENGKAERVNGVIKNNYLKHWNINNLSQLVKSVDRAVNLYNEDKPHSSLQRLTPIEFENKLCNFIQAKTENQKLKQVFETVLN
jgi:transposase InsO family protein